MTPSVQIPRLVLDPRGRVLFRNWRLTVREPFAKKTRARSGGVGKPLPSMLLTDALGSKRQVPVQKEQRREPLLPIQGPKRSLIHVTVDEVETHGGAFGDSAVQDIQEARSDAFDNAAIAA